MRHMIFLYFALFVIRVDVLWHHTYSKRQSLYICLLYFRFYCIMTNYKYITSALIYPLQLSSPSSSAPPKLAFVFLAVTIGTIILSNCLNPSGCIHARFFLTVTSFGKVTSVACKKVTFCP